MEEHKEILGTIEVFTTDDMLIHLGMLSQEISGENIRQQGLAVMTFMIPKSRREERETILQQLAR